jgi:hypothetical protein
MARPSKFTVERRERFLAAFSTGVFPETAARHAGWSPATLYRILGGTSAEHFAFRELVRRAETELHIRLAGTVTQAAFGDPRLALAMLERRFREQWGRGAGLGPPLEEPPISVKRRPESIVLIPLEAFPELTRRLLEDKRAEHAKLVGPPVDASPSQEFAIDPSSRIRAAGLRIDSTD